MVEVKRSTSHGASVHGDAKTDGFSFDLNSWQGLTGVLQAGRDANLSPEAYAEFRNLVLEYAQKRGDKKLREQIDAIIRGFGKKGDDKNPPVTEETTAASESETTAEPPSDAAFPHQTKAAVPKEESAEYTDTSPKAKHTPIVRRAMPSFIPHKYEHDAAQETVVTTPEPTAPYETEGGESAHEESKTPTNTVTAEPIPATTFELKSAEEYRLRIAEIKRIVNAQVKNPISLVDEGNQIGRTYMTALLGAMKATGPGSPDDPHVAMRTLEDAFKAIESYVEEHGNDAIEKRKPVREITPPPPEDIPAEHVPEIVPEAPRELEPVPEAIIEPEPPVEQKLAEPVMEATPADMVPEEQPPAFVEPTEEVPEPVVHIPTPKEEQPIEESVPVSDSPVTKPSETIIEETNELKRKLDEAIERARSASFDAVVRESAIPEGEQKIPVAPMPDLHISGAESPQKPISRKGIPTLKDLLDNQPHAETPSVPIEPSPEPEQTTEATPSPKPVSAPVRTTPEPKPRTSEIIQPPKQYAPEWSVPQSELASPQVTEALTSLLHQWSIFASSGIFGIGPGGVEHPLYIKLSKLSMGEVVAGRFDDADPEVTRIIKDYIDAWRHEQGVAYNPTETFEHYLRRVVQRIIKRQQGETVV